MFLVAVGVVDNNEYLGVCEGDDDEEFLNGLFGTRFTRILEKLDKGSVGHYLRQSELARLGLFKKDFPGKGGGEKRKGLGKILSE